jgi:nitroreductase
MMQSRQAAQPRHTLARMDFAEVIRKRRMVRAFASEPLDPAVVERLLTAANRAPSAGFSQGYALLVLDTPDQLAPFWEMMATGDSDEARAGPSFDPVTRAPLVVVPLSCKDIYLDRYARQDKGWTDRDESRWPVPYWHIDAGMASLLMLLTAVDEGLGACFFGIPPERFEAYRAEFEVPPEYTPIGAISVGYRAPDHRSGSLKRGRKPVEDVVHRGRWRT